jgi:protein phosphatase
VVRELNEWIAVGISAGKQKERNEDAVGAAIFKDRVFLAVADGHWGNEASAFAVSKALKLLKRTSAPRDNEPIGWFFAIFESINRSLISKTLRGRRLIAPETSLIVAHIQLESGKAHWASFGDSFIYLCSKGKKECKRLNTERRTYLGTISALAGCTAAKSIEIDYLEEGGKREIDVYQSVGDGLEVGRFDLKPGDVLILCTDGLPKCRKRDEIALKESDIQGSIARAESAKTQCYELISEALRRGGVDNIACIVYQHMSKGKES